MDQYKELERAYGQMARLQWNYRAYRLISNDEFLIELMLGLDAKIKQIKEDIANENH